MSVYLESSRSVWMETSPGKYPSLPASTTADVVVVGSGIAGLSTAYELCRRGSALVVLDRGAIGRGMTARTSAHLTSALDDFYSEMIPIRGEEIARLHFASQTAAIDRIAAIQRDENIDCDFARLAAYLYLASGDRADKLDKERDACTRIGFNGVARVPHTPLGSSWRADGYLSFPNQGRFHPLKYIDGLAAAITRVKGRLFAETCVTEVSEDSHGVIVKTATGLTVAADAIVVATNAPINDRLAINGKQAPFRTYVIAGPVKRGSVPDHLYWDTAEPYHYVRLNPWRDDKDILIAGGEDHRSGEANDAERRFAKLEVWTHERFPHLEGITHRWSGQVLDTPDYAAFIGRNPGSERTYVVSGDSGQGITHGAAAGMMLTSLILDRRSEWTDVYDPARKPPGSMPNFVTATAAAIANMAGRVAPGEIGSAEDLKPGEGGLLRVGLHKIAVCRDRNGRRHEHSAACTHMGCLVHWNSLEQCWDCTCHGSQFAPDGTALNGPAVQPLAGTGTH